MNSTVIACGALVLTMFAFAIHESYDSYKMAKKSRQLTEATTKYTEKMIEYSGMVKAYSQPDWVASDVSVGYDVETREFIVKFAKRPNTIDGTTYQAYRSFYLQRPELEKLKKFVDVALESTSSKE
jgi:hypothetical protein